jgi:hypothetical protein
MKRKPRSIQAEINVARRTWGNVGAAKLFELRALIERNGVSVALGDICYLDDRWYVTHAGLLRLARRRRCAGIRTNLERYASDPLTNRWVFKATVYNTPQSKGFVGYGDANPSNTSALVRGAEMRVAETRAVNRALRKAYGIGLCSVEELGSHPFPHPPHYKHAAPQNGYGSSNSQPSLRDKLCLLIRNYELDPNLVKRYAADFCGTETLRDASRDLVESFVSTIAQQAANNRAALVCKLNSYNQPEEVRP